MSGRKAVSSSKWCSVALSSEVCAGHLSASLANEVFTDLCFMCRDIVMLEQVYVYAMLKTIVRHSEQSSAYILSPIHTRQQIFVDPVKFFKNRFQSGKIWQRHVSIFVWIGKTLFFEKVSAPSPSCNQKKRNIKRIYLTTFF